MVGEGAVGVFLKQYWLLGAEYRKEPNQLTGVAEDPWTDLFLGWFPTKRLSVVAAYTDLGDIAGLTDQRGFYLSFQLTH